MLYDPLYCRVSKCRFNAKYAACYFAYPALHDIGFQGRAGTSSGSARLITIKASVFGPQHHPFGWRVSRGSFKADCGEVRGRLPGVE
jgi:hypothetical protein